MSMNLLINLWPLNYGFTGFISFNHEVFGNPEKYSFDERSVYPEPFLPVLLLEGKGYFSLKEKVSSISCCKQKCTWIPEQQWYYWRKRNMWNVDLLGRKPRLSIVTTIVWHVMGDGWVDWEVKVKYRSLDQEYMN